MTIVYTSIESPATDQTFYFKLVHPTKGTAQTGLTIANLDATYTRNRMAAVKNDLTALTSATDPHTDNKAYEVDSTNAPGLYRVDFPDAAFAAGVDRVILGIRGTLVDPAYLEVELRDYPNNALITISGITTSGVNNIFDGIIEGGYTLADLLRIMSSALFGKASGGGTTEIRFRDLGDTKNRITATVDGDGNRTTMVLDGE